jgi:hypothetical protein
MLLLFEGVWTGDSIGRVAELRFLFFHYIVKGPCALKRIGLNKVPETARIMDVRKLDAYQDLFMREAVKVVIEFSIVFVKVDV